MNPEITVYMIEWYSEHWYKIPLDPPEYWASITTKGNMKAKPFLGKWRGDIGNREADIRVWEAGERGKRIHNAWYVFTTGGIVIYQPWNHEKYSPEQIEKLKTQVNGNFQILRSQDEMLQLHKLKLIYDELKPKILGSEMIVYSLIHKEAGTIDNILEIKAGEYSLGSSKTLILPQGIYIVDVKSGNVVDNDVWLQLAPYVKCYMEMTNKEVIGALVFHTGAKTKKGYNVLYRSKEQLIDDYADYRHVSALWERDNKNAQPRLLEFPSLISMNGGHNAQIPTTTK